MSTVSGHETQWRVKWTTGTWCWIYPRILGRQAATPCMRIPQNSNLFEKKEPIMTPSGQSTKTPHQVQEGAPVQSVWVIRHLYSLFLAKGYISLPLGAECPHPPESLT